MVWCGVVMSGYSLIVLRFAVLTCKREEEKKGKAKTTEQGGGQYNPKNYSRSGRGTVGLAPMGGMRAHSGTAGV